MSGSRTLNHHDLSRKRGERPQQSFQRLACSLTGPHSPSSKETSSNRVATPYAKALNICATRGQPWLCWTTGRTQAQNEKNSSPVTKIRSQRLALLLFEGFRPALGHACTLFGGPAPKGLTEVQLRLNGGFLMTGTAALRWEGDRMSGRSCIDKWPSQKAGPASSAAVLSRRLQGSGFTLLPLIRIFPGRGRRSRLGR